MRKKLYALVLAMLFSTKFAWAINIDMISDKKEVSTDEMFQISLSIDGEVDGGQIGIKGLDNFEIIGDQTSLRRIEIINGRTTHFQEKVLTLKPTSSGRFTLTALAQENGQIIKSAPVTINVKKSLTQRTKEKLLETPQGEKNQMNNNDIKDLLKVSTQKPVTPSKAAISQKDQLLKIPALETFPKVQQMSPFNALFWAEFLGLLTVSIVVPLLLLAVWRKYISK